MYSTVCVGQETLGLTSTQTPPLACVKYVFFFPTEKQQVKKTNGALKKKKKQQYTAIDLHI